MITATTHYYRWSLSLHAHTSTKLSIGVLYLYVFAFLLTGPFAMREIEKTDQNEFFVKALPH